MTIFTIFPLVSLVFLGFFFRIYQLKMYTAASYPIYILDSELEVPKNRTHVQ